MSVRGAAAELKVDFFLNHNSLMPTDLHKENEF